MAIACFREVTVPPLPPLPDLSVPRFSRRSADSTLLLAAAPYLRLPFLRDDDEDFLAAIFVLPEVREHQSAKRVRRIMTTYSFLQRRDHPGDRVVKRGRTIQVRLPKARQHFEVIFPAALIEPFFHRVRRVPASGRVAISSAGRQH